MVAQQQAPPTPNSALTTKGPQKAQSTQKKPQYDVTQVASDWTNFRQYRQQFDLAVTAIYEMLLRQRDPTTVGQPAYLNVPDTDGVTNLAKQVTSPLVAFNHRKWKAYNLSGKVAISCPVEENAAPWPNLALCERTVSKAFALNQRRAPTHWHQAILAENIMSYGAACTQVWYCTPQDAQYMLGGFPIKLTTHSPLAVQDVLDADGSLGRVMVGKIVQVGSLPDKWRSGSLSGRQDYDQVTLFEDFNKFSYSAVVEGEVIDQYDHGFVDLYGNPMCPWVITLHEPMPMRLGDVQPTFSYSSPREVWIGQPPLMALINAAIQHSFHLTGERYAVRENLTAWHVIKGKVNIDHDTKVAEVQPTGDFRMEAQPNVLPQIEMALQRIEGLMEAGAGAKNLLAGNTDMEASGVAIQGATTLAKAMADLARLTQEEHNADVGAMILAMVKSETQPSKNRKFKKSTGRDIIPFGNRDYSPDYSHAPSTEPGNESKGALPNYDQITGSKNTPIDSMTVEGVTDVRCGMQPVDALPKEQRIQLFMNALQMEQQTGHLILPDAYKYGELLGVSNPQKFISQRDMDQALNDPNSPLRRGRLMREFAEERMASEAADPQFWATQLAQFEQLEERASQQQWQQWMTELQTPPQPAQAAMGGGPPQPGQPPPQPGPPPGAPQPALPPGPPPPPPQGMPNGAPPGGPPFMQGLAQAPQTGPTPMFPSPQIPGPPQLPQQMQGMGG
jgi:hypothetical protein